MNSIPRMESNRIEFKQQEMMISPNNSNTGFTAEATDDKNNAAQIMSRDKIQKELDRANEYFSESGRRLRFHFDDKTEDFYVEIVDLATDKVLETLPPKFIMELAHKMQEMAGLFFDKKL